MSLTRKHQKPYGLIALGVLLIAISSIFMVMPSAPRKVPGGFADRGSMARDALFKSIAPVEINSSLPPVPRGVPLNTERKITKNGSLDLVVDRAETAAKQIADIAKRQGGFVVESLVYEENDAKTGSITIRVPAALFEKTLAEIKGIARKVTRETINASDITEQYVDLETRLQNLKAQEKQYLVILKKAKTVEETLKVTQYLNQVRGEIDQQEGQLQYLARQVDMSSITANLASEGEFEVFGIRGKPLLALKQSFRAMLEGISAYVDAMIALFFYIPVVLLWTATIGSALFVIWKIIALTRKNKLF